MSNVYTKQTLPALIIAAITSLTLSVNAQAQSHSQTENLQDAAIDSLELSSVVVTASKIPQSRRETTKPIQVIDRAEIEKNAGRDLSQILNQQSGIRVNDSFGAPSNGRILYLQGASATNTLILIDGLAVNDPSGTGGLFDLRLLDTNNIERIEILKGSQSTLYGTDAIAGVINIITRKGGPDTVSGNGTFSYGSFETLNTSAGIHGTAADGVSYRLGYSRESSEGISAAENPGSETSFSSDGFAMDSFTGRLDLSPAANLTISPSFQYSDYTGDYDGGAFVDADNEFTLNMMRSGLQAEYGSDSIRLNGDYSYTSTDRSFISPFGENEFEGRFHNADVYGNYSASNYLKLLAGVNYQDYIIPSSEEESTGGQGNAQTVTIPQKDAQIFSPYATIYLENWNGLSAELGYRLNSHSEYGQNSTYSFAPSYRLTSRIKLFASVSTGFKAPTLDELFGPFGANPNLDPQKSLYANIGAEAYLMDQALKLSGQYFNREIDDLIIYASNGFINRDRQNDHGIELSADLFVTNSLTVGGWYNYLDGEITTAGNDGEVTEDNLIRRPTHSIGFRAGVQPLEGLTVRLNGEYNGERSDIYFNPSNNFLPEDVTLDSYLLVNLYAEYGFLNQQVTAFADVRNILDSDFTEVYGYNTMGTSLRAGLKLVF